MSKLVQELANPQSAGIYSLGCTVGELSEAVDSAGIALFDVDLHGIKGKQKLLDVVAQAAAFPSGFGANWDALADALCDLSWIKSEGYVLLLRNATDTLGLSANDGEILQDIFSDTAAYWRQRDKPFWIFFA